MTRPHGRARVSSRNPEAFAVCDRCGAIYNHIDLSWQFDWAGTELINKRILVCRRCTDVPQQQLRAIILPPDPVPIQNPRVFNYFAASTDNRIVGQATEIDFFTGIPKPIHVDNRVTEDNDLRVIQQTGAAEGSLNNEPGTDPDVPGPVNLPRGTDEIPKME